MNHFLPALAVVACIVTGGCEGNKVEEARTKAAELCGYMPTVTSVTAVFKADPTIATGVAAADLICKAVVAWHNSNMVTLAQTGCPMVAGVCIEGEWVKQNGD